MASRQILRDDGGPRSGGEVESMNWDALSAVADVIGVVLVVVSLIYLAIQVRQSNQMALAESERELLENWANAVAGISHDDRTTDIFLRGLDDFESLSNLEKTRFSVIMQRLINTYISAVRMDAKSLVDSKEVNIFGDICFALILTPGGRQWWDITGPYFTVHEQFNERIDREGATFPAWTDMLPYMVPDRPSTR
jgi:hypothetical protein